MEYDQSKIAILEAMEVTEQAEALGGMVVAYLEANYDYRSGDPDLWREIDAALCCYNNVLSPATPDATGFDYTLRALVGVAVYGHPELDDRIKAHALREDFLTVGINGGCEWLDIDAKPLFPVIKQGGIEVHGAISDLLMRDYGRYEALVSALGELTRDPQDEDGYPSELVVNYALRSLYKLARIEPAPYDKWVQDSLFTADGGETWVANPMEAISGPLIELESRIVLPMPGALGGEEDVVPVISPDSLYYAWILALLLLADESDANLKYLERAYAESAPKAFGEAILAAILMYPSRMADAGDRIQMATKYLKSVYGDCRNAIGSVVSLAERLVPFMIDDEDRSGMANHARRLRGML